MNENKTTILIVDDDASARDVLVSILEVDDYQLILSFCST
jgi:CheY-like chemotaxis protein